MIINKKNWLPLYCQYDTVYTKNMKLNNCILKVAQVTIVCLLFTSCKDAATFDRPQPDKSSSLTSFPKRIQGKYLSTDQASVITIDNNLMVRSYDFDFKVSKDSLDSSYRIVGDTIIDIRDSTKQKIKLLGDTIYMHLNWVDTLFNISKDNILKKYKGYYFMNTRFTDSAWEVKEVSLKAGLLTIGTISNEEDIQKLQEISETNRDTISINYTLTRKQFKKFVRQEGFSEKETFTRISTSVKY